LRFLSLVCSRRKRGNCELIARLAVKVAERLGASGELLHLEDFSILECDGCMRCIFKNERCHLEDDVYPLLDKLSHADALFVVAPTYVLSIPGILKSLIDRYLLMHPYYDVIWGRTAVSIGVAGLSEWEALELPLLNLLPLSLGFRIVDSFIVYGAGPGEALLDESAVDRIRTAATELCSQNGSEDSVEPYRSVFSEHCPVCFSRVFERIRAGRYRCPICLSLAEEEAEGLHFSAESLNSHRFTPERVKTHLENWVLRTKGSFRKKLPEITRIIEELEIQI
jgi:multimeric flavodoxin WrbA